MTLTPMFLPGPTELIIVLVILLLLFGGSRLAGLGKSSGRALREFKEETRGLKGSYTGSVSYYGRPVPGVVVEATRRLANGRRGRVTRVTTDLDGRFTLTPSWNGAKRIDLKASIRRVASSKVVPLPR